jgi:hypothetical protein
MDIFAFYDDYLGCHVIVECTRNLKQKPGGSELTRQMGTERRQIQDIIVAQIHSISGLSGCGHERQVRLNLR